MLPSAPGAWAETPLRLRGEFPFYLQFGLFPRWCGRRSCQAVETRKQSASTRSFEQTRRTSRGEIWLKGRKRESLRGEGALFLFILLPLPLPVLLFMVSDLVSMFFHYYSCFCNVLPEDDSVWLVVFSGEGHNDSHHRRGLTPRLGFAVVPRDLRGVHCQPRG